jgi:hypothetical protein
MFNKYKTALILLLSFFIFLLAVSTIADSSDNVSGFAWSSNIGWISFNNTSGGGATNYGVNINLSTGVLDGYAWSRGTDANLGGIGWISFNRSDTGAPPAAPDYGTYLARVDLGSGQISGWARALAYGGGWDGWIKLAGNGLSWNGSQCTGTNDYQNTNQCNWGVKINTSDSSFSGYAWSDMVIGWISFKGSNYGVIIGPGSFNQPPNQPTFPATAETWDNCSLQATSKVTLSWIYSDPENDPQDAYQVLVDNNSDFSSPAIDSCISPEPNTCLSGNSSQSYTPITPLDWNTTYYWKVKVKDNQGNWSIFSNSRSFIAPSHAYPWVDFSWLPALPKAKELIQFTDQTIYYGGASGQSWSWDFGDLGTASVRNPTHSYLTQGTYLVRLGVCDNSSPSPYCCIGTNARQKSLQISFPLPEWEEISPF